MKLTIELDQNNVMGFLTELEAKGCFEVAKAIEDAYAQEIALDMKRQIKNDFREQWSKGYYFKHSDGKVTAVYYSYSRKAYHYGPIFVNGKLMGQPNTLHNIQEMPVKLEKVGFKEV